MTKATDRSVNAVSPPSIAGFFHDRLVARDEGRFWFALALILGVVAAASFEIKAFTLPIDAISSDARMFLSWMGRWDNPGLLNGDFVADYWQAVSPWAFTGVFHVAWELGVSPVAFAKIFPALLFLLVPIFTFRFIRAINGEPLVAFLVTAAVIHYLARANLIVTGTPRAFWPVLLLAMLDGLARGRIIQTAVAQLLLTGTYPQMAMATATMIGLTLLDVFPSLKLNFSRHRLTLVVVCAMATVAGIAPFLLSSGGYAPSFSLAEALQIPTFMPGGRGELFPASGGFNVLCGSRLSFLVDCNGGAILKPSLLVALAFGGSAILFLRERRTATETRLSSNIPFLLMIASILWFTLARAVLFRLHLPNRYTAATELLIYLTAFPLFIDWVRRCSKPWLLPTRWERVGLVGAVVAGLMVCTWGALNVRVTLALPNSELLKALRVLPETAVIGGFVEDLDFSPVLTKRSTLFSRELAIAYQKGYFLPIMARMEALKDIVLIHDPEIFADRIKSLKITHLVIRQSDLDEARLPQPFRGFFDEGQLKKEEEVTRPVGTVLSKLAPSCTTGVYGGVLLISADCLFAAARQS